MARLALGSVPYDGQVFGLSPLVHTLVTLGTPHQSLEAYPFGRAEVRPRGPAGVSRDMPWALTGLSGSAFEIGKTKA